MIAAAVDRAEDTRMRFCKLLSAAFAMLSLACPPSETPGPAPQPTPAPPLPGLPDAEPAVKGPFQPAGDADVTALIASNQDFVAALYGQLAKTQTGNFAASPLSISLALAMTYAGARADTSAAMRTTLRFVGDSDTTHRAFGTLLRGYQPKDKQDYELTIANRLFGYSGVAFEEAFLGVTADHYLAPLEKVDFRANAEGARKHINDWVAETTKSKITDLLPEGSIKRDTVLVLTNAIYFNGTWVEKFDKASTAERAFFAPSGEVKVPTMHLQHHFQYGEADDNQLLTMFYRGGPMALTIVLPGRKRSLAETEAAITAGKLEPWMASMRKALVMVALPKFEISGAALSLKDTLTAMGMGVAFDEMKANFRGMATGGDPNLFISDVFHKAFVDVHEEGTEAAAATGVVMMPTSAMLPSEPKQFSADRPFVFVIHDAANKTVLFMGRVADPRK